MTAGVDNQERPKALHRITAQLQQSAPDNVNRSHSLSEVLGYPIIRAPRVEEAERGVVAARVLLRFCSPPFWRCCWHFRWRRGVSVTRRAIHMLLKLRSLLAVVAAAMMMIVGEQRCSRASGSLRPLRWFASAPTSGIPKKLRCSWFVSEVGLALRRWASGHGT